MASSNLVVNVNNLEKIENFLNDSTYKEIIENSETFNTRLCLERRLRMPFLDPQTGVAQNHCALFMHSRHRIPGLKDGQVYSYPAARWRKSRRQYLLQKPHPPFPAYTHRPFGHLQPAPPPSMLGAVGGGGGGGGGVGRDLGRELGGRDGSTYDSENSNLDQSSSVDANDLKDHESDKPGKDWYYDEMEMHDMESFDDHDLPDSDCDYEESFSQRKKKSKGARSGGGGGSGGNRSKAGSALSDPNNRRGGRGGGRGRGRKAQGIGGDCPSFKDMVETPKKNRAQTNLPNLTPQSNSSSPLTLPGGGAGGGSDELQLPEMVPEVKSETGGEPPVDGGPASHGGGPLKMGSRPMMGPGHNNHGGPMVPGANSSTVGPPPHAGGGIPGALGPASGGPGGAPNNLPAPPSSGGNHAIGGVGGAAEKSRAVPSPYCDFCLGDARENKKTLEPEELVSCSDCGRSGHPSCLQFTANMIISVRKYRWQCIECKYCTICGTSDNDDQLLFCDDCDRGYHMYCLSPPLVSPPEGSWSCKLCKAEFHKPK
ncbi:requim, req/dpf2 [Anopheles darlingi]|uniref:Requim, req/dpf2 n=1 Tax=Anopheles darlingi TaxID=43151 RepID=W5JU44_ANODA|nr:zinc finger protein ubi-d4 B [Anopheles darlingi]ETN66818.1 requim, req/dpf2 [Anopheles darlingi]